MKNYEKCILSLSVALYLLPDSAGRSDSVCPAGLCLVAGAEFRVSLMTETEQEPQLNVDYSLAPGLVVRSGVNYS